MGKGLGLVGLAYKAGKLVAGDTEVSEAVFAKRARLICTASDASTRLVERAQDMPERCNGLYVALPYTQAELGKSIGRATCGIVAFLDPGLSWAFANKLAEIDHDRYNVLREALEERKERAERRKSKKTTRSAGGKQVGDTQSGKRRTKR